MPNRKDRYRVGEIITFRGVWKIDGVEQTPDADSGLVEIWKRSDTTTVFVASTVAVISGNQIQYQFTAEDLDEYSLFFSAEFENGADKRIAEIEFTVIEKKAY